jgi:hypothetical protein
MQDRLAEGLRAVLVVETVDVSIWFDEHIRKT